MVPEIGTEDLQKLSKILQRETSEILEQFTEEKVWSNLSKGYTL